MCLDFTDGWCGHMSIADNEHNFVSSRYTDTHGKIFTVVRCRKCEKLWHRIGADEYCEARPE